MVSLVGFWGEVPAKQMGENPPDMRRVIGTVLEASVAFRPEPCRCFYGGFHRFLPRFPSFWSPPLHTVPFARYQTLRNESPKTSGFLQQTPCCLPVSAGREFRKVSLGCSGLGCRRGVAVRRWLEQLGAGWDAHPPTPRWLAGLPHSMAAQGWCCEFST